MIPTVRFFAAALVALAAGCSSGANSPQCPGAQKLTIAGYSTGSAAATAGLVTTTGPFSPAATFLYFSAADVAYANHTEPVTVAGVPTLTGSDGTTITGGPLVPVEAYADVSLSLFGYSSSVAGLEPNVTYAVSFAALTASGSGCRYGAQSSGSFQTD